MEVEAAASFPSLPLPGLVHSACSLAGCVVPRGRHPRALVIGAWSSFPTPSFNPQDPWAAPRQPGPWGTSACGFLSLRCTGQAFVTTRLLPGRLRQADAQNGAWPGTGRLLADICRRNDPSQGDKHTGSPQVHHHLLLLLVLWVGWRQGTWAVGGGRGKRRGPPTSPGGVAGPELVKTKTP